MTENSLKCFTVLFGLTELVGSLMVILCIVWLGSYRDGFTWRSDPKTEFNWHPLLMTVGMIFLFGNAILVYRAFRNGRKRKLKIAHTVINASAFVLAVIGLQAVFDSHNLAEPPIPNMYSLHSWIGLGSVILFALQWLSGLIAFLFPTVSPPLRASYYPIHVFFGMSAFICAAAAALLGLTEKAIFSVSEYSKFVSEGLLINFIGIIIIVFTYLVIHLVSEAKYKRQPLPEDEMLLTANDNLHKCHRKHEVACRHRCYSLPQINTSKYSCSCSTHERRTEAEAVRPFYELILQNREESHLNCNNLQSNPRVSPPWYSHTCSYKNYPSGSYF